MADDTDAIMDDGDVILSTETNERVATGMPEHGSLFTTTLDPSALEFTAPDGFTDSSKALSVLKSSGIRRDSNVFDQHLTQREDAPRPPKYGRLPYASGQTGLVYDVRMRFHVEAIPTEDDLHPEDPRRIHAIFEAFVEAGLAWRPGSSGPLAEFYMGRIDARMVSEEEVCLVHTKAHWDWIQSLSTKTADELQDELQHPLDQRKMDSVYLSPNTPYCAALSAGGAIEACRAVMLGKVKNVFAVIRPPGHHAEREDAKGFCFFDNVSIATKVCQQEFGEECRKVMILDWDVHHGNGIQQAHYDDPNVLYISIHVHQNGYFYPECSYRDQRGPYGDHLHCGAGAGMGKNVNIPWTKMGMGDADYIHAFQEIVMPIGVEFDPDLVIIAAGFDAAEGDMLGGCNVTPAGYAHMTHMLMSLARGKLAVCLEGGYNLDSIARSSTAVARTLMGEPPDRLQNTEASISGINDVKLVLRQQSRFWSTLYPKDPSEKMAGPLSGTRMHDAVRQWQASTLFNEYHMSPLFVYKEHLSRSYENQVLATPNYMEARPLLVIFHDPPEMLASPDPRTGKLELHNTWLTDVEKTYVDTAIETGFAVIDVNLPKYLTDDDDAQQHEETQSVEGRIRGATQLLTYLFENYVEVNEANPVFLMGTNVGHAAITNWIKANEDAAVERISKTVHFVQDISLQACRSATNDELSPWYFRNSKIFVAGQHNFWATEFARRPKKKFGKLCKSDEDSISEMLLRHKDEVFEMFLHETAEWRSKQPESQEQESKRVLAGTIPPVRAATLSRPHGGTTPKPEVPRIPVSSSLAPSSALKRPPGTPPG